MIRFVGCWGEGWFGIFCLWQLMLPFLPLYCSSETWLNNCILKNNV